MVPIRILVPVAGDIAEGVPAPGLRGVVEVPEHVADAWCDGERAERVDPAELAATAVDVEQVHADARAYHQAVVEQLHADARAYHQAVVDDLTAQLAAAAATPARGKPKA
jgi:hypothetical protein